MVKHLFITNHLPSATEPSAKGIAVEGPVDGRQHVPRILQLVPAGSG